MKKIFVIFLIYFIPILSFGQDIKSDGLFFIQSITTLEDGYMIYATDSTDNVFKIFSVKENEILKGNEIKIIEGEMYRLYLSRPDLSQMPASSTPGHFVIRVGATVLWRDTESSENIPYFLENANGLYLLNN